MNLPESLERVAVNQFVSPSLLTLQPVCVLRRLGRNLDGSRISGLIESPWSIVGTLVHRAIQIADGRSNIIQIYEELIRRREAELCQDTRRQHFTPLSKAIGESGWSSRLAILESRKGSGESIPIAQLDTKQGHTLFNQDFGHEKWFQSNDLGLGGSIDLLEFVDDDLIRITDWKTGPVFEGDGQVKADYKLQLTAYRMLVSERWPDKNVETYLFNGERVTVQVTPEDEQRVHHIVRSIQQVIAGRNSARSIDIASLGDDCSDCLIRHKCPLYMKEMYRTGRGFSSPEQPTSGDIMGTVTSISTLGETTVIDLTLPTGAMVQMRWSSGRQGIHDLEGRTVAAFGLLPFIRQSQVTGKKQDSIMYAEVINSRRAWQGEIFGM